MQEDFVTDKFGNKFKYENDILHCKYGPAAIYKDGTKKYLRRGLLHRKGAPAVVFKNGNVEYYRKGRLHRKDGPAVIKNGSMFYYRKGLLHRKDGPAVIHQDGSKEYWIHVGTDSRKYHYQAMCKNCNNKINYRVIINGDSFTEEQAIKRCKDNPEFLEMVERAIAKFDVIKALISEK
jgi:hypothetical protein